MVPGFRICRNPGRNTISYSWVSTTGNHFWGLRCPRNACFSGQGTPLPTVANTCKCLKKLRVAYGNGTIFSMTGWWMAPLRRPSQQLTFLVMVGLPPNMAPVVTKHAWRIQRTAWQLMATSTAILAACDFQKEPQQKPSARQAGRGFPVMRR